MLPLLITAAVLVFTGCRISTSHRRSGVGGSTSYAPTGGVRHLVYAAGDDGTLRVYDIDAAHRLVHTIQVFSCCGDVRGAAAAVPTHRFYVMYNRRRTGHVASIDLLSGRVVWDKVLHAPGVDRGSLTPDGATLYLPTWESDPSSPYELVVDAVTGTVRTRVSLPPRSHDTVVSLDGSRVFMETKSPTAEMYVTSTATNTVVATVSGYCCGGVLAPFSVNGRGTLMVNDVVGFTGFQIADLTTGHVIASVPITGPSARPGHGIAFTPDERQVWVNDGGSRFVHVFDMRTMPPRQTTLVQVSSSSPHWVTFDIDGRFAYVAGRKGAGEPTDVIDTRTYQRVGQLAPSEDLLEVDLAARGVAAVGNQFGVGRRLPPRSSACTPPITGQDGEVPRRLAACPGWSP
jgi:DNA-binding beta-propeller fold protein YncE